MNLMEHVGQRIRELRSSYDQGRGLSQEALASELKVATNTVSRWETGTYKPGIEDLDKLARFFRVSILTFFPPEGGKEDEAFVRLRKAMTGLKAVDIEELERYAEFRQARNRLAHSPRQGRKKKAP